MVLCIFVQSSSSSTAISVCTISIFFHHFYYWIMVSISLSYLKNGISHKNKSTGAAILFFFPKTSAGPWPAHAVLTAAAYSNAAAFPRGRAPPPMPLGSCASRAVRGAGGGGHFFMRGCVFARDVRFARTRLGAREPRVAARGAHATR